MEELISFLALTLALSTQAFAADAPSQDSFVRVDGVYRNYDGSSTEAFGGNVVLGRSIAKHTVVDGNIQFRHKDEGTNRDSNRLEVGLTQGVPVLVNGLTLYTRGAVGQKFVGDDNFSYYSIEPGVRYEVVPGTGVRAGWRYRDAFEAGNNDQTRTWRVGFDHALTRSTYVQVGVDRSTGDSEWTGVSVGYGMRF